jgi:glycosyltransferase involved in cell wall biosynthesis
MVESIENYMASLADAVITVNERLGQRFQKQNHRVTVLPNYPPLEIFCQAKRVRDVLSSKSVRLIYAGGLSAERGLFKMAEILSAIDSSTKCKLILIGNFSSHAIEVSFWRYAEELNVSYQIEHLGYLSHDETVHHMMSCDIGLCLLNGRRRYHWTEPMKYFEYSAAGMPVILSDLPAMKNLIGLNKNGYVVQVNSIACAGKAIDSFVANRDGAKIMGDRGRLAFKQNYNWEALEPRLFDLYSVLT